MANSVTNSDRHAYASVDTAPGASGYWTNSVSMSKKNASPLFFSRRGTGVGTVTLQYQTPESGAAWQDLDTDIDMDNGVRCVIDDEGHGVKWRAGIKQGNYVSGTIIFGIDW